MKENMKLLGWKRRIGVSSLRGLQSRSATGQSGQAAKGKKERTSCGLDAAKTLLASGSGRSVFRLTSPYIGLPDCRQYVRNVNSAWGACTPAPLPASRRSTHFKPLRILKSPHATTACGAPSRSSDLNGQGRPPLQGGEGDPKPSIRCDREWERFKRIKRRIISCAQLGSSTYERTRTNQEVYYQPTGAKTQ
jgi:hypothetical protein